MSRRDRSPDAESAFLEPTLIGIPALALEESIVSQADIEVSRAKVAVVDAPRANLSDETAALLRGRLQAAAIVLILAVGLLFVRSFFVAPIPLGWTRVVLLGALAGCYLYLYVDRGPAHTIRRLRALELCMFGIVGIQLLWMQTAMMFEAAQTGNPQAVRIPLQTAIFSWFAIIMLYGMFIPNSWQRAVLLVIPPAVAPLVLIAVLRAQSPVIAAAAGFAQLSESAIVLLIAAAAATFGTHTINALRKEAFKARQFGQYRLKRLLGVGGMGEVYLAEHQLLKRPCAIKLIRPGHDADPTAIQRFEREVRATAKLTHWNTVDIYDYGRTDEGTFYYVMEYLHGLSLADLVRKYGPLPAERVVHMLRQTCRALREAHAAGLVHRDIKPANIFAARQGGIDDVVKLLDFGLAKQVAPDPNEAAVQLTQVGTYSGSPQYMSPEQATSESEPDERSDIYSVGAVAYYLLTGQPPFLGSNPIRLMIAHARDAVVPPSQLVPAVPQDLEAVVLRCLAKNPADRYASAESLDQALAECRCAGAWTEERAREWWRDITLQ